MHPRTYVNYIFVGYVQYCRQSSIQGWLGWWLIVPRLYLNQYNPIVKSLRPKQNCHHFADDILKCIFLNGNAWMSLNISLKFVPKFQINNIPAMVHIMAWHRPGDKPLSEPMTFSLLTHICVTRIQWVNCTFTEIVTKQHNFCQVMDQFASLLDKDLVGIDNCYNRIY